MEYWNKYKRTAAKLRKVIKEAKREFWDAACKEARDPGILYKIFRKIRNRASTPPDSNFCLAQNDMLIHDAQAQAEVFAAQYSEGEEHEPIPLTYGNNEVKEMNRPFCITELRDAIARTRTTTPGEDKVSAALFKGLKEKSLELLLQVYNTIWDSGDLPSEWTSAIILPILKPNKSKLAPASYRPIALTSVACKICERMIARRISDHLTKNRSMDHRHLGFLPFRDSQTAVTMLHTDILQAKRKKKFIIGISLDIQAAYDSVYIDGLMIKCSEIGISGPILRWIHNFLSHRFLKVAWRDVLSTARPLGRGVPQGAVLSPILFSIFLTDFFDALEGLGVKFLIYADDIFIYSVCDSLGACRDQLQNALRNIAQWCRYWKLSIRPDKCHAINLSRRKGECEFDFWINSGLIEWSDTIKFLGFHLARRGGFRTHILYLRKKAFARINILKSLAPRRYGARSIHLITLVFATIRSLMDYGAPVLNSACETAFKQLEVLQTSALRVALGLPRWVPNITLRHHAGAPPLKDRIKNMAFRFWIKHLSLGSWSPLWLFYGSEIDRLLSNMPSIYAVLDETGCQPENLINFQFPLPQNTDAVQFLLTELPFQRTDLDGAQLVPYFSEFINSLPAFYDVVATDASKTIDTCTIAGCMQTVQTGYRLNSVNSIFTAEAMAIGTALDEIITPGNPFILLTDSLSVLTALQSVTMHSPKVIIWLHNKLQRIAGYTSGIKLCWVPGHRGIPLNEKADSIAKGVNELNILLDWVSPEDLGRYHNQLTRRVPEMHYRASKYHRLYGDIPPIQQTHLWSGNRREDIMITRLLCRMLITPTILFRFHLVDSAACTRCNVPDSLEHILFRCDKYHYERCGCWSLSLRTGTCFKSFSAFLHAFCSSSGFRKATLRFLTLIDRF